MRFTFLLTCILISACHPKTKNLPEIDALRMAISKSIVVPFPQADTLIYASFNGMCGNSSKDELDRYFEPNLSQSPYFEAMEQQYKGRIMATGDKLQAYMSERCKNQGLSVWDCFIKNKVYVTIAGQTESASTIRIYENYTYLNKDTTIVKIFNYDDNEWTYKILK